MPPAGVATRPRRALGSASEAGVRDETQTWLSPRQHRQPHPRWESAARAGDGPSAKGTGAGLMWTVHSQIPKQLAGGAQWWSINL